MPKLKNVAYYPVEAVKDDKSVMKFMPGQEQEVTEEDVIRFYERYPNELQLVQEIPLNEGEQKVEKVKELRKEITKLTKVPCDVEGCDFLGKNNASLGLHKWHKHKDLKK